MSEGYRTDSGNHVTVSGGAPSRVHAMLDDLRTTSSTLRSLSGSMVSHQATVAAIGWHLPGTAALFAPETAAPCAERLVNLTVGANALGPKAAVLFGLSNLLTVSVVTYEAAEGVADAQMAQIQRVFAVARLGVALVYALDRSRMTGDLGGAATDALEKFPGAAEGGPALVGLVGAGMGYTGVIALLGAKGDRAAEQAGPVSVTERAHPGAGRAEAARSVGDAARRIDHLHRNGKEAAHIQTQRVVDANGRGHWVVLVPGTQDFSANRPNPADGTGNFQSLAGHPSAMTGAVMTALTKAQTAEGVLGKGEPVMVVGHSQGGMVASNLARDPRATEQFNITKVATFGSPVGHLTPGTDELDVVNTRDVVPAASGKEGDDPRRTRVVIDDERSMISGDGKRELTGAHDAKNYGEDYHEAVRNAPSDSQLRRFDDATRPYFSGEARTYVYDAHREPAPVGAR